MALESQLGTYILDMPSSDEFSSIMGIGELAIKLVELKKDVTYPLVYLLMKLALLLPVATATVERAFSVMKIIKRDELMNDTLLAYIERGLLKTAGNEAIIKRYQAMKTH